MDIPSLFMIPSAVSSGKVHSVFPNSTDADFDFNRDSDATRVNSEGLIERVGYYGSELIVNGDFSNGLTGFSTENVELAEGGVRIQSDGSSGSFIAQSGILTSGKNYKLVFEVKGVQQSGSLRVGFSSVGSVSISDIGTQTLYFVAGGTQFELVRNSAINVIIDNVSVKEVTGDRARLNYEIEGGLVNTKCSLLLEPQSTNLVTYSQDLSQSFYSKSNLSVSADNLKAPDGSLSAYKIVESTASAKHQLYASIGSYTTMTISFFAKKAERSFITIEKSGWGSTVFNIDSGSVASGTGSIQDFGNGWFRCIASYVASPAQSQFYIIINKTASTSNYQGDGVSGLYLWGIQAEALSYATSYIPTNGSTQTRAAETCNGAGTSSIFESTEGILYAEIAALANPTSQEVALCVSEGQTGVNRLLIRMKTNGAIGIVLRVANNTEASIDSSSLDQSVNHKVAVKWKVNDIALWIDGSQVGTDTSANVFSANTLNEVSFNQGNNSNQFYGKCRDIRVYNTKEMTDSEVDILLTKITS